MSKKLAPLEAVNEILQRGIGAGCADAMRALKMQAWLGEFDPLESVILQEPQPGAESATEVDP